MKETLLDYINYYTNYCLVIKNLSVTTVNSYLTSIKEFFEYVNKNIFKNKYVRYLEMKINDVNELQEKDFYNYICYLIAKNDSVITRKRKIQCIKLFFDYLCYVKHIIKFNPVMNIEKEKSRLKIVSKSLSRNDFIKLFNYTCDEKNKDIRNKTIISLFINCGLRNSELRNLRLNDFDFTDNKFLVLGKGKKERVCYLNSWVYKNLKTYLDYRKNLLNGRTNDLLFFNNNYKSISSNTLLHIIKNVYKETGIDYKKYDVHSLRHTFATNLYNSNIPINVIQELLGHSCVESTQFYIHINDDKMKKIMNSHPLANITNISTMKIKEKRGKEMENITLHFTQEQIDVILDSLKIYMHFWENVEKTDNTSINRKALLKYTYAYIQSSSYATNCEKEGSTKCNKTEKEILKLLEYNNSLTQIQIANILKLSENCIYKNLRKLKEKGLIFRIGANKNGYWNLRNKLREKM